MISLQTLFILYCCGFVLATLTVLFEDGGIQQFPTRFKQQKIAHILVVTLWPLSVLIIILGLVYLILSPYFKNNYRKFMLSKYISKLAHLQNSQDRIISLTEQECTELMNYINEIVQPEKLIGGSPDYCEYFLYLYWDESIKPEDFVNIELEIDWDEESLKTREHFYKYNKNLRFISDPSIEKKYWSVKLTGKFLKDAEPVDRKAKESILEAIKKISWGPHPIVDNDIKPINDDPNGFWCYRMGDYRLLYMPEETKKRITLLSFSRRDESPS